MTIYKTIGILEKYVLGNKEINFTVKNYQPNIANENINIGLPIFSIHGNHDPPSATKE